MLPIWSAESSMRALIASGFRPRIDTSKAAVPVTCGAAMLVPSAPMRKMSLGAHGKNFTPVLGSVKIAVWLHGAHTNTFLLAGAGRAGPNELLPPGAATSIALRPKLL